MTIAAAELRAIPLFAGMTDRSIDAIGALGHEVSYPPGDVILHEGDEGHTFVLLVDGEALVTQGGAELRRLGPGAFAGEIALIDGGRRTATVTATSTVRAFVIERRSFLELLDRHAAVRLEVLMALTQRLRSQGIGDG